MNKDIDDPNYQEWSAPCTRMSPEEKYFTREIAEKDARIRKLANHVLAMETDAHFCDHPEWAEIVADAKQALKGIV